MWLDFQESEIIYERKKENSLRQTLWVMDSFRNAAAFLLSFKPEWLVGKTEFCCFWRKIFSLCMCLFFCYLYLFGWSFIQLHIFNCGSSFIMLTVSFITLTWSAYKFQTCAWKRLHFLFIPLLRRLVRHGLFRYKCLHCPSTAYCS